MATNPRVVSELTLLIAAEVRRQRRDRHWKQEDLSEHAQIPQGTLSRIERGLSALDIEQIERLAGAFDMNSEQLISAARANAEQEMNEVYLADGALNPANTRGASPSADRLKRLASRKSSDTSD